MILYLIRVNPTLSHFGGFVLETCSFSDKLKKFCQMQENTAKYVSKVFNDSRQSKN